VSPDGVMLLTAVAAEAVASGNVNRRSQAGWSDERVGRRLVGLNTAR
jgi:hypothetical protein